MKKIGFNQLEAFLDTLDYIDWWIQVAELHQLDHKSSDTEDEKKGKSYKLSLIYKALVMYKSNYKE